MKLVVLQPKVDTPPCYACKVLYGASCCEVKTADGPFFPMTYGEAARIAKHVKLPLEQAVDVRKVGADERETLEDLNGADLIVNGVGLYLPIREGACVYLGPSGCTIPQIKPFTCALFPFSHDGYEWVAGHLVQHVGFCFGQDSCDTVDKMLVTFGETRVHLDSVLRQKERYERTHAAHMRRHLNQQ